MYSLISPLTDFVNQCLVVIFFISSSSAPTIDSKSVKDKYDSFKGQWKPKNPTPKEEKPTLSRPEVTQEDFEKAAMPQASADKATDKAADQSKGEHKTNDFSESKNLDDSEVKPRHLER